MLRKNTPLHDKWHRRVEGQIRDVLHSHPEWFNIRSDTERATLINSIAKRIVGEIVADCTLAAPEDDRDARLRSSDMADFVA